MTATGLEVRLQEGRERAEVTRFTRTLDEIVWSLREIDRVYLLRGTRATWVLSDLSHSGNDLVVRLEARQVPARRTLDDMAVPVNAFVAGANALREEPLIPKMFTPNTVRRLARLAAPQDGVQSVSIAPYNDSVGRAVNLSTVVQENASSAVNPFEISHGSVAGHMSRLRETRAGRVGFTLLNEVGGQAVEGTASDSLTEELRQAWRHRVRLGGKIKRNARGQAIQITVDQIERLPEDNRGRPRTSDLLGAAPDWIDGRTTEQWLEEVRGG